MKRFQAQVPPRGRDSKPNMLPTLQQKRTTPIPAALPSPPPLVATNSLPQNTLPPGAACLALASRPQAGTLVSPEQPTARPRADRPICGNPVRSGGRFRSSRSGRKNAKRRHPKAEEVFHALPEGHTPRNRFRARPRLPPIFVSVRRMFTELPSGSRNIRRSNVGLGSH